jgi:hypothetical protein
MQPPWKMSPEHYRNLLDARSQISSITWTVFSVFGAGLAILAGGVASSNNTSSAKAAIAFVGLFASFIWLGIQLRLHAYVRFYRRLIHEAEEDLRIAPEFRLAATPKSPMPPEFRYLLRGSTIATIGIVITIVLWAITLFLKVHALLGELQ